MSQKQQAIVDDFTARVEWFRTRCGYSYGGNETPEQGRERAAIELARAEVWFAKQPGSIAEWEHDHNPDYSGINHRDPLWCCRVVVNCPCCDGKTWEALCNIDLGPEDGPVTFYTRIVEAELASQLRARLLAAAQRNVKF